VNNNQCNGPDCNNKVRGDESRIPDRGTRTGVQDTYGADLSEDATNRVRGMTQDTQSDSEAA
jgi:hypothetical protein